MLGRISPQRWVEPFVYATTLLRRVLKPRLLSAFVAVVATAILATGYLFNAIL